MEQWRGINGFSGLIMPRWPKGYTPQTYAKYRAKWVARYPEKAKRCYANTHLKRKYGITLAYKEALLVAQGSKCAACGGSDPKAKQGWHLDHDHKTGKIRGLLCLPCNAIAGYAADNVDHLSLVISYLIKHRSE